MSPAEVRSPFACFAVLCVFALSIEVRPNTQRKDAKDRKAREEPKIQKSLVSFFGHFSP